jgi:hypothetical protein
MTSTAFVDGAVKAALGLEPREWPRAVQIELAPAGEQSLKVIVTVRPRSGRHPTGSAVGGAAG